MTNTAIKTIAQKISCTKMLNLGRLTFVTQNLAANESKYPVSEYCRVFAKR
jgi:hypothetical protein